MIAGRVRSGRLAARADGFPHRPWRPVGDQRRRLDDDALASLFTGLLQKATRHMLPACLDGKPGGRFVVWIAAASSLSFAGTIDGAPTLYA